MGWRNELGLLLHVSKCKLSYFKCSNSLFGTQFARGRQVHRISSDGMIEWRQKSAHPSTPQKKNPRVSNETPNHRCTKINLLPPQKKHAKYQTLLANNTRDTQDHLLFHWICKKSPRNQNFSNQKIPEKKFQTQKILRSPSSLEIWTTLTPCYLKSR